MRLAIGIFLAALAMAGDAAKSVTWTGWFADGKCKPAGTVLEKVTASNPECTKKCIEEGAAPLFLSEQAKAVLEISGYDSVLADLGYHVQVEGKVDAAGKVIEIERVKRLEYTGSVCGQ